MKRPHRFSALIDTKSIYYLFVENWFFQSFHSESLFILTLPLKKINYDLVHLFQLCISLARARRLVLVDEPCYFTPNTVHTYPRKLYVQAKYR